MLNNQYLGHFRAISAPKDYSRAKGPSELPVEQEICERLARNRANS
jgi:hypothetical protein